jgi:hypothetical protein
MPSPREVSRELLNLEPTPEHHHLSPRPYNFHDPDKSNVWWLVPGTEFPAFRLAKVIVSTGNVGELEIGLHIEKGLGEKVRVAYPAKKDAPLIMGFSADWAWRELVSPGADHRLALRVRKITQPLFLRVTGSHVSPSGSFDPYAPRVKFQCLFEVTPPDSLILRTRTDPQGLLLPVHKVSSLSELVAKLLLLEADEWLWVDVELFSTWPATITAKDIAREAWDDELVHLSDLLYSAT